MTPEQVNQAMARHLKWSKCACNDPECTVWFDPQDEAQLGLPDLFNDPTHAELRHRVEKFSKNLESNS